MKKTITFLKTAPIFRTLYKIYRAANVWVQATPQRKSASGKKLQKFKNTKIGKRCFIIGNGPSLNVSDLEKLMNEDTFAVNRIYKIFHQTNWRPTYYFSQDTRVVNEISTDIDFILKECKTVFLNSKISSKLDSDIKKAAHLYLFYLNTKDPYPKLPSFSKNISKQFFEGFTVAYACIQMAVYMGYSEIYIIGTDHNYATNKLANGTVVQQENVQNYMKGIEGNTWFPPQLQKTTNAYQKAKQVCEKKGIIIKNATRGGKLEVFDRIDFDSLF